MLEHTNEASDVRKVIGIVSGKGGVGKSLVTSPQELVGMIVGKAVKMAEMLGIPVLGIVENMSYFECPTCHDRHFIFGDSHIEELAGQYQISAVAMIPMLPEMAASCDRGDVESIDAEWLNDIITAIEKQENIRNHFLKCGQNANSDKTERLFRANGALSPI